MSIQIACIPQFNEPHSQRECLVLPVWEGPNEAVDFSFWKNLTEPPFANKDFQAKIGETLFLYGESGRVLLIGLGKKENATTESLRRSYSFVTKAALSKKIRSLDVLFPTFLSLDPKEALKGIAEGLFLSNYIFTRLKSHSLQEDRPTLLKSINFIGVDRENEAGLNNLVQIAVGVFFVRDLVNDNADAINPEMLAQTAHSMDQKYPKVEAKILGKKEIEAENMGLLLAVNRGASHDPRLIILSYKGNKDSQEHVVLVGKGITYDTGGLSLKPTDNMLTMKCDMAGAATVIGAIETVAAMDLNVNVTAVVPATENAIDANSYKVGDVYLGMNGKSVEITNTDAEGRLVLADAVAYSVKYLKPTAIIDFASLTGAIVIALGEQISGLFSNNERLAKLLLEASKHSDEPLWQMPLCTDYKEKLRSDYADLVNSGGRSASSITAALFIQEFCGSIPWAHIDFAGTCFLDKPKYYNTTKGTGFGLRLIIDYLQKVFS